MGNRNIALTVYRQICQYFQIYDAHTFLSPYASLIGPSGIGKSFTVQQLARQNMVYVSYTNLAKHSSSGYPRRSEIADQIPVVYDADETDARAMLAFFEGLIASTLVQVDLCREMGITPRGYYEMQVRHELLWVQKEFAMLVHSLYWMTRFVMSRQLDGDYDIYFEKCLREHKKKSREVFEKLVERIKPLSRYAPYFAGKERSNIPLPTDQQPSTIICFDEVGEFVTDSNRPDARYFGLQRAMRRRISSVHCQSKTFFGLLLDTVNPFTSPVCQDKGLRETKPRDLFPPIYMIDTWDLYARETKDTVIDTLPDPGRLFRLGRPLWGSLLGRQGIEGVVEVADRKVAMSVPKDSTETLVTNKALALLSYRLNFDVVDTDLAECLVSGNMRYILGANTSRKYLRTTQPSEPILAHVSAMSMKLAPSRRLEAVKALYECIASGSVSVGDPGEFVAALILLFTFDAVSVVIEHKSRTSLPCSVKLSSFLSLLLPKDTVHAVQLRVSDNTEVAWLWDNGEVFFNHFTRTAESKVTSAMLRDAFRRGMAILPGFGSKNCGIVIPVFVPASNHMSYVVVEVRNKKDDELSRDMRLEALMTLKNAARELPRTPSHISLLMCLQGEADTQGANSVGKSEVIHPLEHPGVIPDKNVCGRVQTQNLCEWDHMNRIVVATVGLDSNVFPGLRYGDGNESTEDLLECMRRLLHCYHGTVVEPTEYHKRLAVLG